MIWEKYIKAKCKTLNSECQSRVLDLDLYFNYNNVDLLFFIARLIHTNIAAVTKKI